jgi:hypothetical protein
MPLPVVTSGRAVVVSGRDDRGARSVFRASPEARTTAWRVHRCVAPASRRHPPRRLAAMNATLRSTDPHAQLRALYLSLLTHQEHFDEFKQLLALYEVTPEVMTCEPDDACVVRDRLNERIREWIGGGFDGLSAAQVLQWRAIVVEERLNVSLSPWKESNIY